MLCFGEPVTPVSNTRRFLATLRGSGRDLLPFVLMGLAGMALSIACHGADLAQAPAGQAGSGAASNAGSFNLWKELVAWLGQFGPAGFVLVVVLAFLGWVVSQAGNLEKVMGWLRPKPEEPPPAEPSSPAQQQTMPSEPSTSTSVSGSHNVVVGGQGNQVLSHVSAGGDVVMGDKVGGDKVAGDKVTGNKVVDATLQAGQRQGVQAVWTPPAAPVSRPDAGSTGPSGCPHGRPGPWRVFLSHTSELRQFPASGSYIAKAERAVSASGHAIVDMADFPSIDEAPAQVCIERVRGCDVYVGIFGMRYGSPVRDQPEVSYTELESNAASEAGIPRLVFLINTEADTLGILPSALIDRDHGRRQDAFLERVQACGLTLQRFSSPAELQGLVERSLQELAASRQGSA